MSRMNNNDPYMTSTTTHATATTATTAYQHPYSQTLHTVEVSKPELDVGYLRTLSGMLKCIAIALDFICFICILVGGPAYYVGAGWATFVCIMGLIISLTLLILYLFRIVDLLPQLPWIVGEMIFCFSWTVFFFICGCVLAIAATRFHAVTGYGAAAFFAIGAMCTYGFDCYLKFLFWRNDEPAIGGCPMDYRDNPATLPFIEQRKVIVNEQRS